MKKIWESKDGYKVYELTILGYPCSLHETTASGCIVSVPYGDTDKEREMFDSLVYYHKSEYWAKTTKEAIKKVRNFIKNYKKTWTQ